MGGHRILMDYLQTIKPGNHEIILYKNISIDARNRHHHTHTYNTHTHTVVFRLTARAAVDPL